MVLCINSYSFVIWAGKSSTKRNIHSKLYFYTSREFLNSKHQRFDSQPHYGHKDLEIREKTSQRLCHSVCHLQEILGSRIRLKTIMELSPQSGRGGIRTACYSCISDAGLVTITAKLASVSLQLSLQLRCRSINRNVSLL